MILFVGVLILALGILSGGALVLASLGVLAAAPGFTLWITFPLLCLIGFLLVAMHAEVAVVRVVSLVSSGLLLVLALTSIAVLVLSSSALISVPASSASLWFVFVVGIMFGSIGAASFGRAAAKAQS